MFFYRYICMCGYNCLKLNTGSVFTLQNLCSAQFNKNAEQYQNKYQVQKIKYKTV